MNSPKNAFNIKDLENLSGIKAHTIRMWEKRYNILQPTRNDNNNRIYDIHALQKILNINTLNKFGYKISVIAKLPEEKIPKMLKEILTKKTLYTHVLNNFKVAMMNFDVSLFLNTYNTLIESKPFRDVFYDCFLPLLEEMGDLWQTDTITPAHEHFISSLIKQKIANNIEGLQANPPTKTSTAFVLYLPNNEIHEIGLMFINYELLLQGYKTVYIGESVPTESLADTAKHFDKIVYITYFTTNPEPANVTPYVKDLKDKLLSIQRNKLFIFGRNSEHLNPVLLNDRIKVFRDIRQFAEEVEYLL